MNVSDEYECDNNYYTECLWWCYYGEYGIFDVMPIIIIIIIIMIMISIKIINNMNVAMMLPKID